MWKGKEEQQIYVFIRHCVVQHGYKVLQCKSSKVFNVCIHNFGAPSIFFGAPFILPLDVCEMRQIFSYCDLENELCSLSLPIPHVHFSLLRIRFDVAIHVRMKSKKKKSLFFGMLIKTIFHNTKFAHIYLRDDATLNTLKGIEKYEYS